MTSRIVSPMPLPLKFLPDEGNFIVDGKGNIVAEIPCQGVENDKAVGHYIVNTVNGAALSHEAPSELAACQENLAYWKQLAESLGGVSAAARSSIDTPLLDKLLAKMPEYEYFLRRAFAESATLPSIPDGAHWRIKDDALNEAGWKLLECAGTGIHANDCKDVAREVIRAYINSFARQTAPLLPESNQLATLLGLLRAAKCPACDGSGSIPHQVREGEWQAEQCQWCDERQQICGATTDGGAA